MTDPDWNLLQRCVKVLSSCADDAVVTGTTAARLHRLWLPLLPDVMHVATATAGAAARAMLRSRRADVKAHRRQFVPRDIVSVNGVPVTSIARTWVDLAAVVGFPSLVAAGDRALQLGCTRDELQDVITRSARGRGIRAARVALPLLDPRSASRPESHLRVAVNQPGLPRFAVNEAVYRDDGGWLAEPDLSLAAAKLALEYQGADHAELDRMRRDITRATDMRHEGWICLFYGPAEVFGRPTLIGPEVRRLIRQRRPDLLGPHERRRVVGRRVEWSQAG